MPLLPLAVHYLPLHPEPEEDNVRAFLATFRYQVMVFLLQPQQYLTSDPHHLS